MTIRRSLLIFTVMVACVGLVFAGDQRNTTADVYIPGQAEVAATAPAQDAVQPAPPPVESSAILYDNGPILTEVGGGCTANDRSTLQTALGLTIYGYGHAISAGITVADDFTVTDAAGWTVDGLCFWAYQTSAGGTGSTITEVIWTIWDGDPSGGGASIVCSGDATTAGGSLTSVDIHLMRTLDTAPMDCFRWVKLQTVTVSPACVLPAGTYWIEWQTGGSASFSGPWVPPVTMLGLPGKPGANGIQNITGVWGPLVDPSPGGTPQDVPFQIKGMVNGGGSCLDCEDITGFVARCIGAGTKTIQARVRATGDHTGCDIIISIDGTPHTVHPQVKPDGSASQWKLSVSGVGTGTHVVTVKDPAGCVSPITVDCGVDQPNDEEWNDDASWGTDLDATVAPTTTKILGNYPNPFNPSTTIRYLLADETNVSVKVFNMLGQEVATLVNGVQKAGEQSVVWHGTNNFGQAVSSGLYIYRIQAGNLVMTEKMMFMK